jgi:D-serine deaminase-like pyridoxal phosphate-dependent protein
MARLEEIATPFLLVDGRRLAANVRSMQQHVAGLGAALRPHFKTHRSIRIAELQLQAGAAGFTCSTVSQAGALLKRRDLSILFSSLVYVDPASTQGIRSSHGPQVIYPIESPSGAATLRRVLEDDVHIAAAIEIDGGAQRTGVAPEEVSSIAVAARRHGIEIVGLFSYPGSSHTPEAAQRSSQLESSALAAAAAQLERRGISPTVVSGGSTPTMRFARRGLMTEYRPGTYALGDCRQIAVGAMSDDQVAMTVVATVVSSHRDRYVIDAGGKALGRDTPRSLKGFGKVCGTPGVQIARMYDYHSIIDDPVVRPAPGERVKVIPNNANSAASLHGSFWLETDDGLAEQEPTIRDDAGAQWALSPSV